MVYTRDFFDLQFEIRLTQAVLWDREAKPRKSKKKSLAERLASSNLASGTSLIETKYVRVLEILDEKEIRYGYYGHRAYRK